MPATARLVRSPARAVGLVALLAAAILIAVLSPRVRPRPSRWADRPPSSIDPPGAPGTSPEPGAAQIAWGLLRGRGDRVTVLTESPGALVNGDSVQITCELSRPSYPHLFWVESEGTVRRLYPEADERATRIGTITWPRDATQGGAVIGSPGTELAVLLVSDSPLMDAELSRLEASLTLHPPLPPLDEGTILIDGQPVGVRGRRNDRGLGGRKALVGGAVAERLAQLRRAIPAEGVTISMLAVPHVASGPSRDDR